ncbi:MAG TPA: bifunctional indole-3-glycerol-phosphate synthase TrpC/phosphoribosylanthranilate isomerase TrpF [Gemmatimonadales bacterium]|nr:bifunctional indole-3-glycerol-phosphate synthase TrpC/phosphoribosylanthranilate isomerase TrpF [Gemmatimonadales bacterium]
MSAPVSAFTPSVLADIVVRKRADVAARRRARPPAELERVVEPATRRFGAALARPGRRFVLECKRRSPSEGALRADFDAAALAAGYDGAADAISVLTDGPFFGGSFADLRAVRARTALPVLCKDFVLEPYQVLEARAHGADAVLLMLSLLDDAGWRACAAAAAALGMDALTEVHDEAELERALRLEAPIVGINNRDLRTLAVDLGTTARLAPRIPRDRVIVCESGIRTRADVDAVADHVDAFLVGTTLVRAARPDLAARELAYGVVKVCGLTTPADACAAYAAGASLGGVILAAESPRRVDAAAAAALAAGAPLPLVGVFVDEALGRIAELAARLELRAVQLHGEETPAFVAALRTRLPAGCEIWKAVRVRDRIPTPGETGADRVLLDGYRADARGGSGIAFDWSLLAGYPQRERVVLAGGLTPENARAAQALGCGALDVCSGVEAAPGVKDAATLARFFDALRGAA